VLPCSAYLEGEYGIRGLFVVFGEARARGIEQIYQIKLSAEEQGMLKKKRSLRRGTGGSHPEKDGSLILRNPQRRDGMRRPVPWI